MTKDQLVRGVELEDLIVDLGNQLATIEAATKLKDDIKVVAGERRTSMLDLDKQHVDFEALKASSIAIITAKLEATRKEFEAL